MTTPILQALSGRVEYHEGPFEATLSLDLDSTDDHAVLSLHTATAGRAETTQLELAEPDLQALRSAADRILTAIAARRR